MAEATRETRDFSKAELEELRDLTANANAALNSRNKFLTFLGKQHEIEDNGEWQLGEKGFVRTPKPPAGDGAAVQADGLGEVAELPPAS